MPDSPLDAQGNPTRYLDVGIVNGSAVGKSAKALPLVQMAERIYQVKPKLDEKTQARLRRTKI